MKAFVLESHSIDGLKLVERPNPVPGPGEVLVKIKAVSLNYRDLLIAKGLYSKDPLPRVPCSDGAGEIVETGRDVARVKAGDRVCNAFFPGWVEGAQTPQKAATSLGAAHDGTLAEYLVLPEEGVSLIPAHLSYEEAATLPCAALTAWNALFVAGNVKPGETVLVQGTGGVSIFALQLARFAGARVLATTSDDKKMKRLLELGADAVCNYKSNPDWDRWAREKTNDVGVDHVIEVGGVGTLDKSFNATRMGGHIAIIGVLTGATGEVATRKIVMKALRLSGIFVGSRAMLDAMNQAIAQAKIKPVIDKIFSFEDAPKAFRHLESSAHFGKVVIRISG
jgi:NADPH:quinone reductase-like Zn-dependent oxidoreductase